ncbi:TetR/AcrR family transcriptional regulator [Wenjunlia tyrosinilytica]|jgi:AcrR family transcriptional regulator|uniref:TetR family transcriptional regulator n=1 Tax=Wenjunlia tyrosinilytica TaxID=1544741 RepID=A0A917ZTD0_9ACTN|nr:TetR/AcrR family transcriptional regulator [Wenjunlia tyrosinilytica]GGO90699.1 TetR family transcriptional regulator [Wenjunlia tyrosinilytica]
MAVPSRTVPARPRRRTQRERSEATSGDLLDAARELFARDGYAATSLEAVCERAGVSKGGLYHHFRNKEDLFRVVCAAEQKRLAAAVSAAYRATPDDSWLAVYEGCRAFLEASMDPAVQRITLLDAPGALDGSVLREIRSGCQDLMKAAVERAVSECRIARRPVEPLATLLYGGICEAAMAIARSPRQEELRRETLGELRSFLAALAVEAAALAR